MAATTEGAWSPTDYGHCQPSKTCRGRCITPSIVRRVLATEGDTNLKSQQKRNLLVDRFGEKGFDYVGNDHADLPVWKASNVAYVVSSSSVLIAKASAHGNVGQVFDAGKSSLAKALFKAMRPHQWMKNLLVFVPLLAAQRYDDEVSILLALLAFVVFGLTASSVYLLNDLVDVADDRHHARKRNRPFASGNLSLLHGWLAWPGSLIVAFVIAGLTLPHTFVAVLAAYFVLTLAYSLALKKNAMIDVLALAALYTLRVIAGAAAVSVPLSFWLQAFRCSSFFRLPSSNVSVNSRSRVTKEKRENFAVAATDTKIWRWFPAWVSASGYLAVLVLAL